MDSTDPKQSSASFLLTIFSVGPADPRLGASTFSKSRMHLWLLSLPTPHLVLYQHGSIFTLSLRFHLPIQRPLWFLPSSATWCLECPLNLPTLPWGKCQNGNNHVCSLFTPLSWPLCLQPWRTYSSLNRMAQAMLLSCHLTPPTPTFMLQTQVPSFLVKLSLCHLILFS